MTWRDQAACIGLAAVFFAEDTPGPARERCRICPVHGPCLTEALADERGLAAEGRHGIRGGLTPAERARLAQPRYMPAVCTNPACGRTYQHRVASKRGRFCSFDCYAATELVEHRACIVCNAPFTSRRAEHPHRPPPQLCPSCRHATTGVPA